MNVVVAGMSILIFILQLYVKFLFYISVSGWLKLAILNFVIILTLYLLGYL